MPECANIGSNPIWSTNKYKMRFAIKHIPSGKFYCEDESGAYLVNESDGIISWGKKETAEYMFEDLTDMVDENGLIFTENGEFPLDEFQVSEI
jgi:hypothetical protein